MALIFTCRPLWRPPLVRHVSLAAPMPAPVRKRVKLRIQPRLLRPAAEGRHRRRSLGGWYAAALDNHPYKIKALGTGLTYVCCDLTAQALEKWSHGSVAGPTAADAASTTSALGASLQRAITFGAVGGFWVGPLLTAWFGVMERFVPGRGPAAVAAKLLADQVLQGPFMIASMFAWTALLQGASEAEIEAKLRERLWDTWVNSVGVWAPVQLLQQTVVPMKYRVTVANLVSYFWDTYLSIKMMGTADPAPSEMATERAQVAEAASKRAEVGAAIAC